MKTVLVDTGAFFADSVAEDEFHERAKSLFDQAARESWDLVTTNAVVSEAYTLLRKRAHNGREVALAFLDDIEAGICRVVRADPEDETKAIALLRAHDDKEYSFCDALSFVVMERLDLGEAIAFDRDFRSCGRFTLP